MGSRTRSKILGLFFSHPNEEFYVREVERRIKENINSVRRELNKLMELGILLSYKKGNQRYFRINKNLPIYEELKMIFIKTDGLADELKQVLGKEAGIESAFIYGSWAEGKEKLKSDVDLFIIGEVDENRLISGLNDLEKRLSREINYVIFLSQEVQKRVRANDPFVKNVMEGSKIFLVGDPGGTF